MLASGGEKENVGRFGEAADVEWPAPEIAWLVADLLQCFEGAQFLGPVGVRVRPSDLAKDGRAWTRSAKHLVHPSKNAVLYPFDIYLDEPGTGQAKAVERRGWHLDALHVRLSPSRRHRVPADVAVAGDKQRDRGRRVRKSQFVNRDPVRQAAERLAAQRGQMRNRLEQVRLAAEFDALHQHEAEVTDVGTNVDEEAICRNARRHGTDQRLHDVAPVVEPAPRLAMTDGLGIERRTHSPFDALQRPLHLSRMFMLRIVAAFLCAPQKQVVQRRRKSSRIVD